MNKPYIKISAQFIGKNIPKERRGLTQTWINFDESDLRSLIRNLVIELCKLHQEILEMGDDDILSDLSEAIDDLEELMAHVRQKISALDQKKKGGEDDYQT